HRKDSVRHPGLGNGRKHSARDDLRRTGMRGMRLYDDRTPRGKRRRGVTADYRKGDREVRCAEDRNGAERHEHTPEIRTWKRLPMRQCAVDPSIDPRPFLDEIAKQAQLPGGPSALALEPGARKGRLGVRAVDDLLGEAGDPGGDCTQETGASRRPNVGERL